MTEINLILKWVRFKKNDLIINNNQILLEKSVISWMKNPYLIINVELQKNELLEYERMLLEQFKK